MYCQQEILKLEYISNLVQMNWWQATQPFLVTHNWTSPVVKDLWNHIIIWDMVALIMVVYWCKLLPIQDSFSFSLHLWLGTRAKNSYCCEKDQRIQCVHCISHQLLTLSHRIKTMIDTLKVWDTMDSNRPITIPLTGIPPSWHVGFGFLGLVSNFSALSASEEASVQLDNRRAATGLEWCM